MISSPLLLKKHIKFHVNWRKWAISKSVQNTITNRSPGLELNLGGENWIHFFLTSLLWVVEKIIIKGIGWWILINMILCFLWRFWNKMNKRIVGKPLIKQRENVVKNLNLLYYGFFTVFLFGFFLLEASPVIKTSLLERA